MRSPLLGLLALSGALAAGALPPSPGPTAVVPNEGAVAAVVPPAAAPAVPPAPPPPAGPGGDPGPTARYHRVWCPDCSGRGLCRAVCETCDGSGKVWRAVAPPTIAKLTRQLQRAAQRALARAQHSPAALRARGIWTFTRRERRSMARGAVRTLSGRGSYIRSRLTEAEVLRAL